MTDERMIAKAIEEAGRRIAVKLTKIEMVMAEINARAEMNTPVVLRAREDDLIRQPAADTFPRGEGVERGGRLTKDERKTIAALRACSCDSGEEERCKECPFCGIEEGNCVNAVMVGALELIRKLLWEEGVEI